MVIYLYVKTHLITKIKYLGKTTKADPYKYKGSGVDWRLHLKEFGNYYTTEIIKECTTKSELNYWGRYYSNLWNVANSNEWANCIPETGGGCTKSVSLETREKIRQTLLAKGPRSKETRKRISEAGKGRAPWNKGLTKDIDDRVAKYSKQVAISQLGRTPWNKGKVNAQEAWNKGLTKDTDDRVAKYATTLAIVNKGRIFKQSNKV